MQKESAWLPIKKRETRAHELRFAGASLHLHRKQCRRKLGIVKPFDFFLRRSSIQSRDTAHSCLMTHPVYTRVEKVSRMENRDASFSMLYDARGKNAAEFTSAGRCERGGGRREEGCLTVRRKIACERCDRRSRRYSRNEIALAPFSRRAASDSRVMKSRRKIARRSRRLLT